MTTDPIPEIPTAPKFKRGDVVRFNSSGPAMTVTAAALDEDDTNTCMWFPFADGVNPMDAEIHSDCLTLVAP